MLELHLIGRYDDGLKELLGKVFYFIKTSAVYWLIRSFPAFVVLRRVYRDILLI